MQYCILFLLCFVAACNTALKEDIPVSQDKKTSVSPRQEFSIHYQESPSQFSVKSFFQQEQKTSMEVISQKQGKITVCVYRVLQSILFLDSIKQFPPIFKASEIAKSLAFAKGQDYGYFETKDSDSGGYGDFILEYQQNFWIPGQGKNTKIELKELNYGLYLVEIFLDHQVAYIPLLVSSIPSIALAAENQGWLFLGYEKAIPENSFFLFSGGEKPWQRLVPEKKDFWVLKSSFSDLEWFLVLSGSFAYCIPIEKKQNFSAFPIESIEREHIKIAANKRIFSCGDIVECSLSSTDGLDTKELSLWYQEKEEWLLSDKQSRVLEGGRASFFFSLEKEGIYCIRSDKGKKILYVLGKRDLPNMVPKQFFWEQDKAWEIFLPGKNSKQWIVLSQEGKVLDQKIVEAFSGNRIVSFTIQINPERPFRTQCYYEEQGQMVCEEWNISQNEGLDAYRKSILESISWEIPAQNHEKLYQKWAKEKIFQEYSRAFMLYKNGKYQQAAGACIDILCLSPDHKDTLGLLGQIEKSIPLSTFAPLSLLERCKSLETQKGMPFQDWLEEISNQSHVPIEISPEILQSIPTPLKSMEALPDKENALFLLQYALEKRNLSYKIENGFLVLTQKEIK
ncbi:MAG: hypothetical protein HUU50_00770 [Candidatus Brocadiae bacterium]|nr:hypothetical protein [Candidatus Brocadiia bacterium]